MFDGWTNRNPSTIFDDNLTWIQILSGRLLFLKTLGEQFRLPETEIARRNMEWHVQLVNGMLTKGVLGYA